MADQDDANTWTGMLGGDAAHPPADPMRALDVLAVALITGSPAPRDYASWLAAALRARREGARGLDELLGLAAARERPPQDSPNERLRFVGRGLQGPPWRQAKTLVAIVHGTGVAPTPDLQREVAAIRRDFDPDELPGCTRTAYRIITGTGR